jgi:hypothetical protein
VSSVSGDISILILTFVFGGAAISASALAFSAMFPILPLEAWAVLHGIFGFVVCIIGRYKLFERIMEFFVALMFITVVGWRSCSLRTSESSPPAWCQRGSPRALCSLS